MIKKLGFSLIEVIVALLITSIISLSLYNIYSRIQRSVFSIQDTIELNIGAPSLYSQLEKDFTGIFVPNVFPTQQIQFFKQQETTKPPKQIKNIFVATKKDKDFIISFLTTGGFRTVDSKGIPLALPYIYRVVYTVEPDEANPGFYNLKRSQQNDKGNLDFDIKDGHRGPAYSIGGKFKKFNLSMQVYKKAKDGQKAAGVEKISEFISEEIFKKYGTNIPAYVEVSGIFGFPNTKKEVNFSYKFVIPEFNFEPEEKSSEKPEEKPVKEAEAKPVEKHEEQEQAKV